MAGEEIAAFVVEPIQGEGGYIVPPKDYFKDLKKLTDSYGMLFVSDEVQAGYFRAGKPAALDNFGVHADIYTFAKSVGAGLPLGVTMLKKSLPEIPAGTHATTFGGNLAVVAGAHALAKHVKNNMRSIEEQVHTKGRFMKSRLEKMKERYEIIGDVRGMGMMLAIELVKDRKTKEPAIKERDSIMEKCFYDGLLMLPAGVSTIRIIPPITMSMHSIEEGLGILENAVEKENAGMLGKLKTAKARK